MNKNTNTQTDNETPHMSLQTAHFSPHFFKTGKYLLPLLAGLFILAACGGGGAAPAPTVTPDTTEVICANNLFDDACNAPDVETKRNEKIEECFTGDAAGNADCKNAVEEHSCLEDPFDATCTADTDFAEYLEPAKKARAEFCRQGNNISEETELCGNAVSSLCPDNPFDTVCFADETYRDMRIAACSGAQPPTDSATVCRRSEITDIVCAATGVSAAPFNTTVCGADDGVIYAAVRQEFCRANLSDGLCTNTISTFCATIDAVKFTDSLCGTSASAAVRGTYCVGLQAGDRPGACGDDATEGSLIRAYCEGGGAALSDTANCAVSLANACLTAPFGDACTTDDNIRAQAVMCRNNTNGSNSCDATRTVICEGGGVAIDANIFDDLCDVGYDKMRTTACANAPNAGALPSISKCGSETTTGYLFDYCKTPDGATNNIHCLVRYAASGVRAERWQTDAVDATNENPLKIIPAGEANKDDALTNFIVGGKEGLGFVADGTIITQILRDNRDNDGRNDIRLDAVTNNNEDRKSGFGYTRILRGDVASTTFRNKTYVGLLSGTDVGAPIHDNTKTGVWIARLTFLLDSVAFSSPSTFNLDVNFGDRTLKTRANSRPWVNSDGSRTLGIDGKFTNAGVLYGTTDFYVGVGSTTSSGRGTISGLIGVDGAVGVFASDTLASNAYAGGFVATLGGCTDHPFNAVCTSDADFDARLGKCRGDIMTNGAGGCDATARVICVDGRTGPNPITANILDPLCLSTPAVVDGIIGACNNAQNNQGVFADCPAFLAEVCPISGARHADCPAQVQTGNADFILWKQDAKDTPNADTLTILDKITGTSDPQFSYIQGRADGLDLDFGDYLTTEQKNDGIIIGRGAADNYHRILRLSDLAGGADNTTSGVAFREFTTRNSANNQPVATQYYAGILSGTDLGAPISATGPITTALWDARLEMTILSVLVESDFTMEVNFNPNTIETRGGANAVALRAIGNDFGFDVTRLGFHINGKFTNTGVLYGTTTLENTRSRESVGLLTGLIGEKGAVGVFFTNDNQQRAGGIYVGGFVATPITSCEDYPFADMCTTDADIRAQLERCRDDIDTNGVGGCNATLNIICDVGTTGSGGAIAGGDPFVDPLCASSSLFDNVLVKACLGDETGSGKFSVCADLIQEKCPFSGVRNPECPAQVQTGNADFIRWKQDAVDTDGTTPLTILPEVGADDAEENYVQAGADELNNDVLFDKNGNLEGTNSRINAGSLLNLDLSDVGLLDDTASGMKVERYRYTGFTTGNSRKLYAGIFSGTDLGAPLTANPAAETIWNAKFVMVDERGFHYTTNNDFTLEVNFTDKTIRTRAADPIKLAFGTLTGTIILTGKFTEDGVIYGTSQVKLTDPSHATKPNEELTSDGSLTGLIGEKGAVGAFISDGALDDAGRYAGGFVARNNTPCLATPFDINCYESLAIILARADMCEGNMDVNGAGGCVETVMDICSIPANSSSAINPFHAICTDGTSTYDESRRLSCISNRNGYSGDSCALLTTRICDAANDNNPLNTICLDGTNTYEVPRQAACVSDSIDNPVIEGCAPVITALCTADPFNPLAGAGDAKFNCLGSDLYHGARQDACLGGRLQPDVCTATIDQTCDVDKEYFSGLCKDTNDDNFEIYEQARINTCADNADEIQSRGATAESGVIFNCFDFLDVDCSQEPFEEKCYVVNLYDDKRLDKCSSDLNTLASAGATPADCNRAELSGAICAQTGENANPFAPICAEPTAVAVDFDLVAVQQGFCRDGANINGADCTDTVENFCDVASGADLFDNLCFTGTRAVSYDNYRVAACQVDNANTDVSERCPLVLSSLCPETGNRSPACAPAEGTLPTSVWVYTAPNADNTGRLKILESAQQDDADTNYVQGDATGLNLGELLEAGGERKAGVGIEEGVLSITSLDNVGVDDGDATGGVAFIRVNYDGFTSTNKVKYYAGLLNNVDLGGPLPETTANAIWHASFSAIIDGAVQTDTETTMVINFDNNTNSLTTNDDDLVMLSNDAGSITINANFTAAGVIYGTSSWTVGDKSSAGSVTGLIGAKGAIGAFVSSGNNTDGEYAGGFVAAPVAVECVGLVAFTDQLCDGAVGKAGRIAHAETCRTTDCPEFVNGMDAPTISDCTNKTGSNPHQAGCLSDSFDAERIARNATCIAGVASYDPAVCGDAVTSCFASASANNCGQLVAVFCGAETDNRCTDDAPALAVVICRDLPFDTRCDTGYDEERQTACAGEDVTTPRSECMSVISTLCTADPLNNAAGAGAVKFDCAGSATYKTDRETACAGQGQDIASPSDSRCLPVFADFCNDNPFNNAQSGNTVEFNCLGSDNYHTARQAVCDNDLVTNDCTATIALVCADDVFDNLCFDRVNDGNYSDYETERVSYCQKRIYRTDNFTNDTVDSRTCAAFVSTCPTTPFDDKCKIVDTYASDRLGFCKGTITDLTAAYGTPADCNTVEFSGVICAQTGVDANPFAPICADPTAVATDLDLVAVQQGFCRDGANINGADCADTITNFCDVASGANLFDDLCNTGATAVNYTDYRVAACNVTDANTDVHSTCASVISTNCTGNVDTDSPACVPAGTLPTSAWLYGATNKDNTARLEILEEVGTDDAYTNYIQGDEAGLNLDVLYNQGTLKADAIIRSGILSITDLDNVDDNATGGVVAARISLPEFTDNPLGTKHRYYAGLLSNVDLGGPLRDNSANGIWNARFYALYGTDGTVQTDLETSLIVNFEAKSIKTRELADIYGPADPVVLSGGAGRITINANFTTAGVIYGKSGWSDGVLDGNSSTGTLTGLIGKYGAIGAFVGSGKNIGGNTQGEYAGGFVAAPLDCITGTPLNRLCDAMDNEVMMAQKTVCDADLARAFDSRCAPYATASQKTMFAEICRLDADAKGCDLPINGISGLTVAECADNDTGNPYNTGCADDIFDAERTARDLSCKGNDVYDASQCSEVLGNCFGSVSDTGCDVVIKLACDTNLDGRCVGQVPVICGDNPLSIVCETGYDAQRQAECSGQSIDALTEQRCLPVINALCEPDPFATAAGPVGNTFDCTVGDTYLGARQSACAGQDIAAPIDSRCVPILSTLCAANPFNNAAGLGAMTIDCTVGETYKPQREEACNANPVAYGDGCDYLKVPTCIGNDQNLPICRDDERYAEERENGCPSTSPSTTRCGYTVIAYRCRIDPLNSSAGLGFQKYDCSTFGEVETRVATIDADGNIVPAGTTIDYADVRSDRILFCKNPDNSQDARCLVPTTAAFIDRCAKNPFDTRCESFGNQYATDRTDRITNCLMDASPPECAHQGVRAELLISCNSLIDNREPAAPGCALVTAEFCSTAFGADVFNSICDADYTQRQVAACRADTTADPDGGCVDLIANNCEAGSSNPECAIATAPVWEDYAVNSNNTARLTVLDEAGADDPVFNYVKAGADGLNLDFIKDENGDFKTGGIPAVDAVTREVTGIGEDGVEVTITVTDTFGVGARWAHILRYSQDENEFRDTTRTTTIADERVLKSYDGGTYEDTAKTSGVAFAHINYGGFAYDSVHGYQRYYAGILSGTDLGGVLTTKTETEWTGKFGIMVSGRYYTKDFTLTIDFTGKTISGSDTHKHEIQTLNEAGELERFDLGITEKLTLDGDFNDAGVIYGTSKFERSIASNLQIYGCTNSLCTLRTYQTTTEGSGGRVNVKDGEFIKYTSTGSLTGLIGERGAVGVFVSDGASNEAGSYVGGFVVDNPDVSPDCSAAAGTPFDLVRCPNAVEARRDLCINRAEATNLPSDFNVDSHCDTVELVALICRSNVAPLDSLCTDDFYDDTRQRVCGSQDVDNPSQALCVGVIEKLCTAEPFNARAGAGGNTNKLDCLNATSQKYIDARKTRIALCLDEATDDDPLCAQAGVRAVLATCAADPLDAACTGDIAEHYTEARNTRLTTCRMDAAMRGDVICTGSLPTICASGDTPFSDLCVNNDIARIAAVDSCLASATADADVCNTVVLNGETVKGCLADPYNEACADTVFYAARAKICETEATSFTAGCLTDSDFASNYRPVEVAEASREAFLARCTDPDPARDKAGCHTFAAREARAALITRCADTSMPRTNCDTIIANNTTLLACIANPFLTDCSAEAVASALMTHRDALVARCADSGNTDKTGCEGAVGGSTIASCITTPSGTDCAASGAFASYIEVDCRMTANLFAPRCQDGIDEAVIIARAELALGCAANTGTGCDTIIVSGSLTVNHCNTNPFATGCEDAAFANARRVSCIGNSSQDGCSVAEGQGVTSYVQGGASELDLGESIYKHDNTLTLDVDEGVIYVEDDPKTKNIDESVALDNNGDPIPDNKGTPRDESRVLVVLPDDNTGTPDINESRYLREGIVKGGLTLNNLVVATDNENHGFAFAYIPEGRGGSDGTDRYYAGLLSGTDVVGSLGGALTAAPVDATWNGKIAIVSGLGGEVLTEQADFVLTIDFDNKTLKSGDIAVPRLGGLFAIDGKFTTPAVATDSGVIYGATRLWEDFAGGLSSIGSVIGLIGQDGAVGAFISSGEGALVNTLGEYAGGFVASETAPDLTPPVVDACNSVDNVLNPACANTPYDIGSCVVYDLDTLKAESSPTAPQMRCIPVLERLVAREKACAGEADLNNPTEPLCEAVIARVCDGSIFKTDAGTGDTKFDCMSVTRYTARRTHICSIPAYRDGATVELNGRVFVTPGIDACDTIIARDICMDNPFAQTKTRRPANLCGASYNMARETTCAQDIINVVSAGAGVASDTVSAANAAPTRCFDTILRACADNPFDTTLCSADNVDFTAQRVIACNADMTVSDTCAMVISTSCPLDGTPRNAGCRSARFTEWADDYNADDYNANDSEADDSDAAVAIIPEDETKKARILLGRANGLDTKTNVTSIHAPEFVLRLSLNKYNRVPHPTERQVVKVIDPANPLNLIDKTIPTYTNVLNQDYASGIAVFSATTTNGTIGHYAGILSGTDVGVPITDDSEAVAIWRGDFAWVSDDGAQVKRAYGFRLNVNYDAGTISTPTEFRITDAPTEKRVTDALGHVPGYANTDSLSLNAFWKSNGILIGTTTLCSRFIPAIGDILDNCVDESKGTLTGMIGNDGAVGVFASNDEQPLAYAGGFIAKPTTAPAVRDIPTAIPATGETWVTETSPLTASTFTSTFATQYQASFIAGSEDGLGLGLNPVTGVHKDRNFSNADEYLLRLDDTSGVAFFYGNIGGERKERFFAGLLSGSTVGENLPYRARYNVGEEAVATAIWGGTISGIFPGHADTEFGRPPPPSEFPHGITLVNSTSHVTDTNFQLEINFEASTIKTPKGQGVFGDLNFRFDGRFNRNGIIRGDVIVAETDRVDRGNGRFTGIIGETAAIGVFRASKTGGQQRYIGGFIVTPCGFDVFNPTCADKDDTAAITAYCNDTTANKGTNPFNVGCNNEVGIESLRTAYCTNTTVNLNRNPFNVRCNDAADIEIYRRIACVNREAVDTQCPVLIVEFCLDATTDTGSNPFNNVCKPFETDPLHTDDLSIARNNACLDFGTQASTLCRNRSIVLTKCTPANPYAHVGCNTVIESHISNADRLAYCATADGLAHPSCPNANSGKWVASFTDDEELTINPNTTAPTNEFLQIEGNTISTAETTEMMDGTGGEPTPTTLDFSAFSYGGVSFGADDGLAYFNGYQATMLYHYAGIFATSDVGLPIAVNTTPSVMWAGMLSIDGANKGFTLTVVFDDAEDMDDTVKGFIVDAMGAADLLIDGTFDANGVITGDVHLFEFTNDIQTDIATGDANGILSGLIGVDGAVAVFISKATGDVGYAGGFVATPSVATCKADVFDTACPVRESIPAIMAFCTNIIDNAGANPFKDCMETVHGEISAARRNSCLSHAIFPDVTCPSRIKLSCELDYFAHVGCPIHDDSATILATFCATEKGITTAECPNANSGNWVASFTGGEELTINPDTASPTNEFLQIEGNTISTMETTKAANDVGGEAPDVTTLNFSAFSYGGVSFPADDGLAYFSGYQADILYHYAGIFATSDLGAPIAINTEPNTTWDGMLKLGDAEATFNLTVVFDGSNNTVKGFIANISGASDFLIDGTFNAKGVITGDVHFDVFADETTPATPDTFNGELSGLIGADGAVAVFTSTATGDVGYAGGFVATPLVATCKADVFDTACPVRESIPAIMAFCTNIIDNAGANPFNAECMETIHGQISAAERDSCLAHAIFPDPTCQGSTVVRITCELDYFAHVGCEARDDSATILATFCATNTGIAVAECPNATSGDWVASLPNLNTDPATATDAKNEFLQIADKTISIAGTTAEENGTGGDPTRTNLDFGEFSYGGLSLSADDGLAYFSGYQGSTLHYYAGIFGSTDLGAPIDVDTDVTWSGMLSINGANKEFILTVVFNSAGGMDNTVKGFVANPINANPNDLLIAGTFDANGVLEGDVHFADFASETTPATPAPFNGSLSGLISTQGAIAVFISTATDGAGYAGGFIATHSVDTCKADVFDTACPVHTSIPAINAFCTNITDNAGTNPFNANCSQASDSNAVETAQRVLCLADATFPHVDCQTLVLVKIACVADPFTNAACATRIDYDTILAAYCATPEGFANPANCPNANSGRWVASRTDLNTDPATTDAKNEFLQIADKTISTMGTTKEAAGAGGDPEMRTLNLSELHASFSADDGLAYFSGYQGDDLHHYAGIFGTSDLGAPIAEDGFSAGWTGMLSINGTSKELTLTVAFSGSTGTVDGFVVDAMGAKDFLIDGDFTANGVITGDVHLFEFTNDIQTTIATEDANGDLSGLVGADGAVAVFISDEKGATGYAGGFVAAPDPQASFADWVGGFAGGFNNSQTLLDVGADVTGFAADTTSFITLNDADKIILANETAIDPTILRLDSTALEGQKGYESGVAFWHGMVGTTPQYYAGLLVGTDLGAPLTDDTKDGTWTGKIDGITNGDILDETEIKFQITFNASFRNHVGTIRSIANEDNHVYVDDDTLGAVNVNAPNTGGDAFNNTFDFSGLFNEQGVIRGSVSHRNNGGDVSGFSNGTFTGLIGEVGTVGVFKSHDNQPYDFIGGFVATPPAGN